MPSELTVRSGRVKHARRLATRSFRASSGEFLAEGPQAVREAVAEGLVVEVFATAEATQRHAGIHRAARDVPWHVVTHEVLDEVADAVTPQGLVARCVQRTVSLAEVLAGRPRLLAICAEIRDPGNAGSVMRAADAVGADAVVFAGDCVDPWNPKAVRASVGSLVHVPLVVDRDLDTVLARVREAGVELLAADGAGDVSLYDAPLTGPTAWVFGNEAHGLSEHVRSAVDAVVSIPIHGRAESLNLAAAAAVCLYASARAHHGA